MITFIVVVGSGLTGGKVSSISFNKARVCMPNASRVLSVLWEVDIRMFKECGHPG